VRVDGVVYKGSYQGDDVAVKVASRVMCDDRQCDVCAECVTRSVSTRACQKKTDTTSSRRRAWYVTRWCEWFACVVRCLLVALSRYSFSLTHAQSHTPKLQRIKPHEHVVRFRGVAFNGDRIVIVLEVLCARARACVCAGG
jgi:hypothetical protein